MLWRRAQRAVGGPASNVDETLKLLRARAAIVDAWFAGVLRHGAPIASVHGLQAREENGLGAAIPGLMHVSMVAVDPAYWRRKLGSAMIEFAVVRARDEGYHTVQLFAADANVRACRLYESFGFVADAPEIDDRGELVCRYRLTI